MSKRIYFSPSDQVKNLYAVGNTNEAVQCRRIARAAVAAAQRCGFEAKTNNADGREAMDARIRESNVWGADLHVPIHTNASSNGKVKGTRLFCYDTKGEGYKVCKAVMARLAPITPGNSDSITAHRYAEVIHAVAPTAYIEVAFHDNAEEAAWIIDHTEDIAEAIVHGICDYYGVAYIGPTAPAEPEESEAPTADYTVGMRLMESGCKGDDVKALQLLLIGRGYSCGSAGADGSFGSNTERAVRNYQKAKGLTVDGVAGHDTMTSLLGG